MTFIFFLYYVENDVYYVWHYVENHVYYAFYYVENNVLCYIEKMKKKNRLFLILA